MIKDPIGTSEAAALRGCDDSHIRRLILDKKLPAIKIGRDWIMERETVLNFKFPSEKTSRGRRRKTEQLTWENAQLNN